MQLKYKLLLNDNYSINRKNIPYYDFTVYFLPCGYKVEMSVGLSFRSWNIPMNIINESLGIIVQIQNNLKSSDVFLKSLALFY